MSPRVDVVYAANMQPGDWYAGRIEPDAPTRHVQEFAAAHSVAAVTPYTDENTGERMLQVTATHGMDLFPVPASTKVLVIRGVS